MDSQRWEASVRYDYQGKSNVKSSCCSRSLVLERDVDARPTCARPAELNLQRNKEATKLERDKLSSAWDVCPTGQ